MEGSKINPLAFGYAAAILSALCMLLIGILGKLGLYQDGVNAMSQWHIFFSLSIGGIIAGIVEAAVIGFAIAFFFAWVYNKFV